MSSPHRLHELLRDGNEINIVCHNNPDPDCLASALALGRIAGAAGNALPQAVDYLVRLEGVRTAIVFGIVNDSVHVSARSPDARVHVGNVLREAFEDVGSGGGHHDVAGGEIPLGIFADYTSDGGQLLNIVEQIITARLIAELNLSDEIGESESS